jgi:16S rRNA processing protein RimM
LPAGSGYVEIGYIRKPVGLEGWCGVTPHGKTLAGINLPACVFTGTNDSCAAPAKILEIRQHPKGLMCLFEGVQNLEEASSLSGKKIFVNQEDLEPAENGGYYHYQLRGMKVVTRDGSVTLGTVKNVINYPSVDALEVDAGRKDLILIPMTKDAIQEINAVAGTINLNTNSIDELFDPA